MPLALLAVDEGESSHSKLNAGTLQRNENTEHHPVADRWLPLETAKSSFNMTDRVGGSGRLASGRSACRRAASSLSGCDWMESAVSTESTWPAADTQPLMSTLMHDCHAAHAVLCCAALCCAVLCTQSCCSGCQDNDMWQRLYCRRRPATRARVNAQLSTHVHLE